MTRPQLVCYTKRLEEEIQKWTQEAKYWRIEATTDHDRWLRVLEENERLRKAGDGLVFALESMDIVMDMDSEHPEVKAWHEAKEGKPSV